MEKRIAFAVQRLFWRAGFCVQRLHAIPRDCSAEESTIIKSAWPFSATSASRLVTLIRSVAHICRHGIPGAIVECGVWRGGSVMASALAVKAAGQTSRDIYLFDTFTGMTQPGAQDGQHVYRQWRQQQNNGHNSWCYASIEDVKQNVFSTGYAPERLHFVAGKVEDTLPAHAPDSISLLRLDTDWYESTKHELVHLFPRLSPGGILIVDDYGSWAGCRKAVDEYFAGQPAFLHRIDESGCLLVKPSS